MFGSTIIRTSLTENPLENLPEDKKLKMNKKSKEIIFYVVTFVGIFIVPNLVFHYFSRESDQMFYEQVREDYEICMQRAEQDSRDKVWCGEIKDAARLSYSMNRSSNNFYLLLMFQPLLFVLLLGIRNLRKEVEELKEKINA